MLEDLIGGLPVLALMIVGGEMIIMCADLGHEPETGEAVVAGISLGVLAIYAIGAIGCVLWWGAKALWAIWF